MYKSLDSLSKFLFLGTVLPLFAALFTPLFINSQFLFPFITPKTLFFRVVVEISVFFYLLLILRRPEFRPKLNKILTAVLIFLGIITVASLLGVNVYRSFWGNIERGEGLLTVYHVFAFFFVAAQVLKSRQQWLLFLNGSILVSLVVSVYGFMQVLGADVLNTTGSRIAATIGNASFFAGFLLFSIFLSGLLLSKTHNKGLKIFYSLVIIFQLYLLVQTETRGAFLGLLAGLIIMALIYLLFSKGKSSKIKYYSLGLIAFIFLAGLYIWSQRESAFVQNIPILQRLTSISFDDITTQSRLLTWDSSWKALQDRPLLGYGWENYNVAFNKYFHPEIFRDAGSQIWFDRAHNIIFDVSVTSGFLGIIAYLGVFAVALLVLYKDLKKNNDLKSAAFLAGLLLAYLVQNMFVFDVLATYISFYTLLGFIAFIEFQNVNSSPAPASARRSLNSYLPGAAVMLLALLAVCIYGFNVKPAQANLKAVEALIAQNRGQLDVAGDLFQEAIDMNSNQTSEIRQKLAEYAVSLVSAGNIDQALVNREVTNSINEIKENIKEFPYDVQYHLFLMILYNRSSHFDAKRLDLLQTVAQAALKLSPTRPQIYYEIGQAYINQKKFAEGIKAFQTAVDLQPLALESHWNLAAAYILAGQADKADEEFKYLEENGYEYYSLQNLRKMINVYNSAQDWTRLADVYENLAKLEPNSPNWYAQLAATYQRLGDTSKAVQAVQRAVELEPSLAPQAEAFLKELGVESPTSTQ